MHELQQQSRDELYRKLLLSLHEQMAVLKAQKKKAERQRDEAVGKVMEISNQLERQKKNSQQVNEYSISCQKSISRLQEQNQKLRNELRQEKCKNQQRIQPLEAQLAQYKNRVKQLQQQIYIQKQINQRNAKDLKKQIRLNLIHKYKNIGKTACQIENIEGRIQVQTRQGQIYSQSQFNISSQHSPTPSIIYSESD